MRADVAAAFFDFDTKDAFLRAVKRGQYPRPTSSRMAGKRREPLWALAVCEKFVVDQHALGHDGAATTENEIVSLL